jgi:hypothetical protein
MLQEPFKSSKPYFKLSDQDFLGFDNPILIKVQKYKKTKGKKKSGQQSAL